MSGIALAAVALTGCGVLPPVANEGAPALAAPTPAASASAAGADGTAVGPRAVPSAPVPAHFQRSGFAVHWRKPSPRVQGDDVQVWREGSDVRVAVISDKGLGQVELWPLRGVWPHGVQVQFQYTQGQPFDTLEALRLEVLNPAHMAGDEEPPLVPDGFIVWQREGRLAVELPGGWLAQQQGLRVTWVERHRQ